MFAKDISNKIFSPLRHQNTQLKLSIFFSVFVPLWQFNPVCTGSPTINWKTLRIQEFPLPPIKEQKLIAEILWAADEAMEKWISTSSEMQRLSHAFSVNSFLLHEARKKKPSIPDGWDIGPVTKVVNIDPRRPKNLSDDLEVSFVPMEGILETGGISKKEDKELGEVRKGYTYFAEGDILFAKITPCMENN